MGGQLSGMRTGRISETEAVGLLRGMLEIPSPSRREAALAQYLVRSMRAMGIATRIDEAGNVIGEVGSADGPTVMLIGHMDTVEGDLPVRSIAGRLYGRGAVDAKGPLAAMICAAAGAAGLRGKIVVIGAVEEETPCSRGAMEIRRTHSCPDAMIIGEPSGWANVVLGYKGKLDLRYVVRCRPTHPSNPLPKASELAVGCWNATTQLLGPRTGHNAFDQPGATLVSVRGGLTSAVAELSIRTPPGFDSDTFVSRLSALVPNGDLTVVNSVAACRTSQRDPIVRALRAGIRRQHGEPAVKVKTATSDMNTLAEVWSVPMATYGPGDSRLDHCDDEHILITDYLRSISVLRTALAEFTQTRAAST